MNTRHQSSEAYPEKVSICLWMLQNGYNHKWDIRVYFIILIFSYAFLMPCTMCACVFVCLCVYLYLVFMLWAIEISWFVSERAHTQAHRETFTALPKNDSGNKQSSHKRSNVLASTRTHIVSALFVKTAQLCTAVCSVLPLNQIHSIADTILSTWNRIKYERILAKTNTTFTYWHNRISITYTFHLNTQVHLFPSLILIVCLLCTHTRSPSSNSTLIVRFANKSHKIAI